MVAAAGDMVTAIDFLDEDVASGTAFPFSEHVLEIIRALALVGFHFTLFTKLSVTFSAEWRIS